MKRFGLIGHPIAHSLSPALFKAGYDGRYPYELIETADFEEAYGRFLEGYDGINVTAPFKELAFAKADILSEECKVIKATNLLVKTPEGVKAYNSDYLGVQLCLKEMVLSLSADITGKKIPFDVKYLVYTAISSDTGCFRYNNVRRSTFSLASELLWAGVPMSDINHKLFGIKSLKQMQVEHAGFERMNFYSDGKIAVITFPYDLKKQYGAEDETLETLIDVARCIKGVEVAAVVKQPTEEKRFRVSLRSSTDFDVSKVCSLYGGGGHERAAGCTLICDSILAAEITIVSAIENSYADMKLSQDK